jgi:hypothetical protein
MNENDTISGRPVEFRLERIPSVLKAAVAAQLDYVIDNENGEALDAVCVNVQRILAWDEIPEGVDDLYDNVQLLSVPEDVDMPPAACRGTS